MASNCIAKQNYLAFPSIILGNVVLSKYMHTDIGFFFNFPPSHVLDELLAGVHCVGARSHVVREKEGKQEGKQKHPLA